MTPNREQRKRGAPRRTRKQERQDLDRRRDQMKASEGHAGSVPRGNQPTEDDNVGQRRGEWDRLLGH